MRKFRRGVMYLKMLLPANGGGVVSICGCDVRSKDMAWKKRKNEKKNTSILLRQHLSASKSARVASPHVQVLPIFWTRRTTTVGRGYHCDQDGVAVW